MSWSHTRCNSCLGKGFCFKIQNIYDAIYHRLICNNSNKSINVESLAKDLSLDVIQVIDYILLIKKLGLKIKPFCIHNKICSDCLGRGFIEENEEY